MDLHQLSLYCSLGIRSPAVVSFFGAGGKTTLMLRLAAEILQNGHKVLLTTTTKIYIPGDFPLFISDNIDQAVSRLEKHYRNNSIAVLGNKILSSGKIGGIKPEEIGTLRKKLPVSILIEADGARGKPLKGYNPGEPVLPKTSDLIIAVIGADSLGSALSAETIHRCKEFLKTTGNKTAAKITENMIADSYLKMITLGQHQAPDAKRVLILNKADQLKNMEQSILKLIRLLADKGLSEKLLITEANRSNPVKLTLTTLPGLQPASVACIVLAAGTSSRMGTDKLLLPLKEKPILEHTVQNIKNAGFQEIIVVTRPNSKWNLVLDKLSCRIVENSLYESGMASSLKAGLLEVNANTQGILFALGDQPMVQPEIYRLLTEHYNNHLKLVTCPVYKGQRGNPVIFDRRTWPQLMELSGDRGGRAILLNTTAEDTSLVATDSESVVIDIDTVEDYNNLRCF